MTDYQISIDMELAVRLRDHATKMGVSIPSLVEELIRDYLDGTGPWATIEHCMASIRETTAGLEQLHASLLGEIGKAR